MKKLIQILAALAMGSSILSWAVQAAYLQRGCQAIGGEYLLALFTVIAVYWIVGKI